MISYDVRQIRYDKEVRTFVSSNHYTHTCPAQVKFCYGLFDKDELIGVITISNFSRLQSQQRYFGCLELSRLFVVDGTPKNTESFFIGSVLRILKKNESIYGIVSYADTTEGHSGTVYKASNFKMLHKTKPSYHYIDINGKRIHKKQVWARSRMVNVSERVQAMNEGLTLVQELPKIVFYYEFKKPPEIKPSIPSVLSENEHEHVELEICGKLTKIDKDDLDKVLSHQWYFNGYFYTFINEKRIFLHRFIHATQKGFICDHINRDRFDNRKTNLREASRQQNNANKIGKNKLKGVRINKGKYEASIVYDRRTIYLGRFDSEIEAAVAYDKKAVEIHGSRAVTNFDISRYDVPEKSLAEIEAKAFTPRRYKNKRKCLICERMESAGSHLCKRHLDLFLATEERNPDGSGTMYTPKVQNKLDNCSFDECGKKVFAGNLCFSHWRIKKIAEGASRTRSKKKYFCTTDGCDKSVFRSRLCKLHWREKFGVDKKKLGRPSLEKKPCLICGQFEHCSQLCLLHYNRFMYYRRNKKLSTVAEYVSMEQRVNL